MDNASGAIYLRLSRDDSSLCESESIKNQRLLLKQYAALHQIPIAYEFIDDGISGTSWNREALQNLLKTIESGRIHTVLVKDLSRLSRDYIRTGELLESWFPAHGVRLISVNDGVDTGIQSAMNDFFPIRAVMDDWYARDISRKVRAAIYARQQAGFCTAAALPFGYHRCGDEILIDSQKSEIVKQIFIHYSQGESCCKIANMLNDSSVPQPQKCSGLWHDASVRRILCNPAYIGRFYLHKSEKRSYKSANRTVIPEENRILYPIPPIVSEELFYQVQEQIKRSAHRQMVPDWLSGIVFCAVCGSRMHCTGDAESGRLICGGRKRYGTCRNSSLRRAKLMQMLAVAFAENGILIQESMYKLIIRDIHISPETVSVRLFCRKPDFQPSGGS